jgi:DNA-binding NarL/FixJ family response regulator
LPGARIIILSAYPDPDLVKEAVQIGVAAYLLKSNASTEILKAIRTVLSGKTYLCVDAANVLMMNYRQLIQDRAPREKVALSDRELDVLKLIAEGLRTKEIADRLNIGIKTVETHRAHLMSKLGCKSPVELAKYALREGIAPL